MKIIVTHVCPPIPTRSCDWRAHWDGMEEDGPYGDGETREQAINGLFDNTEVADLASWFGIETREVDTLRGPEYGHWIAFADGESVEAAWEDQAIVDLAVKLAEVV